MRQHARVIIPQKPELVVPGADQWFSLHTHSRYSKLDGMTTIDSLVSKAARMRQPAIGLSDHGSMAGVVQLYQSARKHDIQPWVGFEGYLLDPNAALTDKKAERYHFGLYALDLIGYRALLNAMSLSHTRPRFNRFPRLTLDDLMQLGKTHGKHLVITTGCFFGLVQQRLVNGGERAALGVVRTYQAAFPNTVVEVQHHNITHSPRFNDTNIAEALHGIAVKLGLPVVATQDSHYTNQNQRGAHALMKKMVYGGVDDEFPGDSFHLATAEWVGAHYLEHNLPDVWASAVEGSKHLQNLHKLELPALDSYKAGVPAMHGPAADAKLALLCRTKLATIVAGKSAVLKRRYQDRLGSELAVIRKVGMANYFHILIKLTKWLKHEHICAEVRGSGNGSLVLFVLGVTTVDPIKWDTLFERFLAEDRIQPPDVDLDIEDARRGDVIAKLQEWFPGAVQIGTWSNLGIRGDDDQGSIVVTWKAYRNRIAKEAGRVFKDGWVQSVSDVAQVSPRDAVELRKIDKMRGPKGQDGVLRSYGVHAAGVLLPGGEMPIADYIPTMLVASSNTTVTQFDQDDVEKLGYLKLDVLGQTSLTVMRLCQQLIGRKDPTDFSWIPDDDPDALKLMSEGRTDNGIFHFEGFTKAKGAQQMKMRSTKDVILAIALFMPGAMDVAQGMTISQTDLYLQRRRSRELRENVTYLHPVFEEVLKPTHGTVIYQDQVINIMRRLGMSTVAVNKFFKVVKDSGKGSGERNRERLAEVRAEFDQLCIAQKLDPDAVWQQTASFVSYGFNKGHATGYGLRAYRSAYLKAHHSLEYIAALLHSWAGRDKEVLYVREARRIGIRLLPPDVNVSHDKWTIDRNQRRPSIRKGLVSIKGVGEKAASCIEENAPYEDLDDMIARLPARPISGAKTFDGEDPETLSGVFKALLAGGALNNLLHGS